jgi:hypothetical protein
MNSLSLGAVEKFNHQHQVSLDSKAALARLSTVLEWQTEKKEKLEVSKYMSIFV